MNKDCFPHVKFKTAVAKLLTFHESRSELYNQHIFKILTKYFQKNKIYVRNIFNFKINFTNLEANRSKIYSGKSKNFSLMYLNWKDHARRSVVFIDTLLIPPPLLNRKKSKKA